MPPKDRVHIMQARLHELPDRVQRKARCQMRVSPQACMSLEDMPKQAICGTCAQVVVFTASLAKYADPLLDLMDKGAVVRWRLFREACCPYEGNYVKVRATGFLRHPAAGHARSYQPCAGSFAVRPCLAQATAVQVVPHPAMHGVAVSPADVPLAPQCFCMQVPDIKQ